MNLIFLFREHPAAGVFEARAQVGHRSRHSKRTKVRRQPVQLPIPHRWFWVLLDRRQTRAQPVCANQIPPEVRPASRVECTRRVSTARKGRSVACSVHSNECGSRSRLDTMQKPVLAPFVENRRRLLLIAALELATDSCGGRTGLVLSGTVSDDAGTTSQSSADAQAASSLPVCSWPTPTVPPNDAPVEVAADRTVLICGVGNVNSTFCLSASKTECTPENVYGPCQNQCSPCKMLCAANEYAIGAGMPEYLEPLPGGYPYQSPNIPRNCRNIVPEGFASPPSLPGDLFWGYWCCPCE
jgi:hypothetical protein